MAPCEGDIPEQVEHQDETDRGEKEIEPLRKMTVEIEEGNMIEAGQNCHVGDTVGDVLMAD